VDTTTADTATDTALIEAAEALSTDEDLDALLRHVASLATASLGFEAATLYLYSEADGRLRVAATAGGSASDATELAIDDPSDTRASVRAARALETVAEGDTHAVPLVVASEGNAIAGVLEARGAPGSPGASQSLVALAELAAVAVERSRLRSALDERSEWYERLSEIDAVTGLANRRTLTRALELECMRASRQKTALEVVVFDIVGFAGIVERAGRAGGDEVLRRVARLLASNVRLIDTVGRYGADEFVVLAPGATGTALEQRIVGAAASPDGDAEPIGLRAGRAVYPDDGTTADELLVAAERHLREGAG
jgi:diguanylate cyclase (GGDEF)-like protein